MKGNFVVSTRNTDRAEVVVVIFSNNTIEADNFVVSTGVNSILQEFKEVFKDQIQLHPMYEKELMALVPGELAKHAVSEGTKAVTKFTSA